MKTKAEASKALAEAVKLKEKAEELKILHGIDTMEAKASKLQKEVAQFCVAKKIERLDLKGTTQYGRIVQSVQERIWITTRDDIPEGVTGVTPLKSLLSKEVFMKITKRVADPDLIEEAILDELITVDEISKAYVEKMRSPYLRVFDGNENGKT